LGTVCPQNLPQFRSFYPHDIFSLGSLSISRVMSLARLYFSFNVMPRQINSTWFHKRGHSINSPEVEKQSMSPAKLSHQLFLVKLIEHKICTKIISGTNQSTKVPNETYYLHLPSLITNFTIITSRIPAFSPISSGLSPFGTRKISI
jgi:hypothetical protein